MIRVYLEAGERPPMPTRMQAPLPWESHSSSPLVARFRAVMQSGEVRTVEDPRAGTSCNVVSEGKELAPA